MIFCCDFWWRTNYPKFYEHTVAIMKGADGRAFLTREDLDVFVEKLRKQLDKDKPKGHTAHINFRGMDKDGKAQLYLESGRDETDVARLFFHKIKNIVTYGEHSLAVFDVKKGGAA